MKTSFAIVLASAVTLTIAQTGAPSAIMEPSGVSSIATTIPDPLPSSSLLQGTGSPIVSAPLSSTAPILASSGTPPAPASNSSITPQSVSPSSPNTTGSSNGVTVQVMPDPNGDGVTPVVIGPNGPEPVQLVFGPGGTPVIQGPNGLIPVARIIGPNGQPLEPVPNGSAANSASASASAPTPGAPGRASSGTVRAPPSAASPGGIAAQSGYYDSGVGSVKVTAAFALAVGTIIAFFM